MNTRSSGVRGLLPMALVVGLVLLAVPEADAHGGGHASGGGVRVPHISPPRQTFQQPRMPRAATPSRGNSTRPRANANTGHAQPRTTRPHPNTGHAQSGTTRPHPNTAQAHRNSTPAHPNSTSHQANLSVGRTNHAAATVSRSAPLGTTKGAASALGKTTATRAKSISPYIYSYGHGPRARHYRAYGYGFGFRNRYYRRGYVYGRSQGSSRAIVARLRSVHASLARIDRDYQGHRVRSMQAIAMAIRQISHRPMGYRNVGLARGGNNGLTMGMRRGGFGAGARRGPSMPQSLSDARMSRALRTLQGVNMQLNSHGYANMSHARASGYVQHAMGELQVALSIR